MPIRYTVYGCKFKCGQPRSKRRAFIEQHEEICWYNPIKKTCKTCRFEVYEFEDYGFSRDCNHPNQKTAQHILEEALSRGQQSTFFSIGEKQTGPCKIKGYEAGDRDVPPIINCELWRGKNADE